MDAGSNPFGDLVSPYSQHGLFIMLYGPPGEGKTTVAAQMDKPLFVATAGEQGIHIHKKHKRVDPTIPVIDLPQLFDADCIPANSGHPGWEKAIEVLDRFGSTKHDRKTLVFDSVSGLEQISYQHCASRLFDGKITDPEFTSFARGATMAANVYWQTEFLPRCLELAAKGFNVVLIAHSSFKNTRNPIGPDFDKYRPELGKTVFEVLNKSLQGLFYLGRDVSVMVNQATKKKIVTSDRRFIGLMPSTYYEAKSWLSSSSEGEVECGDTAAETWANLRVVIGA
jgi:DNA polymerase III delta prime subunit